MWVGAVEGCSLPFMITHPRFSLLHVKVATISFASNQLRTLHPLLALADHLPDVVNLSFEGNLIADLAGVEPCLKRLSKLREIVLRGNPIAENAAKSGREADYRRYVVSSRCSTRRALLTHVRFPFIRGIARRFPTLEYLDTVLLERPAVEAKMSMDAPAKKQQRGMVGCKAS